MERTPRSNIWPSTFSPIQWDYTLGTPLRFSPVMVEIFCLDWAPRKIAQDCDAFTLVPDVLAAWIRFVRSRRSIPEGSLRTAVDAAYEFAPEMIELSQDPEVWAQRRRWRAPYAKEGSIFRISQLWTTSSTRQPKRRHRCPGRLPRRVHCATALIRWRLTPG
jgi:hypothetical protein